MKELFRNFDEDDPRAKGLVILASVILIQLLYCFEDGSIIDVLIALAVDVFLILGSYKAALFLKRRLSVQIQAALTILVFLIFVIIYLVDEDIFFSDPIMFLLIACVGGGLGLFSRRKS